MIKKIALIQFSRSFSITDTTLSLMALIISIIFTQHDLYWVFRLLLGILVGKAREFIKESKIAWLLKYSNELLAMQNYISLILELIIINKSTPVSTIVLWFTYVITCQIIVPLPSLKFAIFRIEFCNIPKPFYISNTELYYKNIFIDMTSWCISWIFWSFYCHLFKSALFEEIKQMFINSNKTCIDFTFISIF